MFETGDLVRLKSGGATMTYQVKKYNSDLEYHQCVWTDKDGKLYEVQFEPHMLEQVYNCKI